MVAVYVFSNKIYNTKTNFEQRKYGHNQPPQFTRRSDIFKFLPNSWKPKIPKLENLKPVFFSGLWFLNASYSYKIYIYITHLYITSDGNVSFTEGKWKQTDK